MRASPRAAVLPLAPWRLRRQVYARRAPAMRMRVSTPGRAASTTTRRAMRRPGRGVRPSYTGPRRTMRAGADSHIIEIGPGGTGDRDLIALGATVHAVERANGSPATARRLPSAPHHQPDDLGCEAGHEFGRPCRQRDGLRLGRRVAAWPKSRPSYALKDRSRFGGTVSTTRKGRTTFPARRSRSTVAS